MKASRLNDLEQYIFHKKEVSLEELANVFNVSKITIRRDLNEILPRGNIKKVYGGVSASVNAAPVPESLLVRTLERNAEKQQIGMLAASLVKDGMAVFVDSGAAAVCMLPFLAQKRNITVITNSLDVLIEASRLSALNHIVLGGVFNSATASYIGNYTQRMLEQMSIDMVFIAAAGISVEKGLSNITHFEAEIKRCAIQNNKKCVLIASHRKFNKEALFSFGRIEEMSAIVTDRPLPAEYAEFAAKVGIDVFFPAEEQQTVS